MRNRIEGEYWRSFFLLGFSIYAALLAGCMSERKESPTKGHLIIAVSESVSPVIEQEKLTFEELYVQAKIDLQITSTREAIARLFNDSILVIVSSRPLNQEEREIQKKYHLAMDEYKIAIDGVAIVVNKENPISQLRTTQLDSVFRGVLSSWATLGWEGSTGPIEICLPDRNSGLHEIVWNKILHGHPFALPTVVTQSSPEMLKYVWEHSNSVGMVGMNWIHENKGAVKVLELSDPEAPDSLGIRGEYYGPHQAHLYRGYYPLISDVYIYSRADRYGVGAGFIAFITSGAGQKIVLNSGLVPATMPVRLVEVTSRSLE